MWLKRGVYIGGVFNKREGNIEKNSIRLEGYHPLYWNKTFIFDWSVCELERGKYERDWV